MKIDLYRQHFELFDAVTKKIQLVEVPALMFLRIDGTGNPNEATSFQEAVEALYSVSYTLKFSIRDRFEYKVMPLEGLWWVDDMSAFSTDSKEDWKWTVQIMQPDVITPGMMAEALDNAYRKKKNESIKELRFERWEEGLSAQILHKGPYAAEAPTIEKLHREISEMGYRLRDRHHEIYVGDPRRAKPDQLKTIIRQPIIKG